MLIDGIMLLLFLLTVLSVALSSLISAARPSTR